MYHNFIHIPVDGHLRFSHVLATVNISAMNIGVNVSFDTMFFLQVYVKEWDCRIVW